jgi:hypothetical protein
VTLGEGECHIAAHGHSGHDGATDLPLFQQEIQIVRQSFQRWFGVPRRLAAKPTQVRGQHLNFLAEQGNNKVPECVVKRVAMDQEQNRRTHGTRIGADRTLATGIFGQAPVHAHLSFFSLVMGQLDRASTSIPLNIAEGNGKFTSAHRCRFFDIARGSALESAAALDVLVAKGRCSGEEVSPGKDCLWSIQPTTMDVARLFDKRPNDELDFSSSS